MAELVVSLEPWATAWPSARELTVLHSIEVDGGVEPRRQFKVDETLMNVMAEAGVLKVITARVDGHMIGYFTWNIHPDPESQGLLVADQGAWFVLPGWPRVAHQMFDESIRVLKELGVQCIFPHHRTQGRGRSLGRFFTRRGAKEIQHTYSLWIGD